MQTLTVFPLSFRKPLLSNFWISPSRMVPVVTKVIVWSILWIVVFTCISAVHWTNVGDETSDAFSNVLVIPELKVFNRFYALKKQ